MKSVLSTQYLLNKLRVIETVKPDIFKEIFSSYRGCLAAGLGYYFNKKPKPTTKEDLVSKVGIDASAASFISDLSQNLDIDLELCYELFTAFLLYDYTGPTRDMKALVNGADKRNTLFMQVADYVRREQVSLLLSIVEILKLVQKDDQQSPNLELLKEFVVNTLPTRPFVDQLLIDLNNVWTRNLENPLVGNVSSRDLAATASHYFVLQESIIRVMIWLFYVADLPPEYDAAVLKFFVEQNFGRKQFYKKYLPAYEATERVDRIFNLEMLFTMKLFQLELLLFLHYDASGDRDSYWLDDNRSRSVTTILESAISPISLDHSGLALAYTLNLQLRREIFARDDNDDRNNSVVETTLMDLESKVGTYGAIARRNSCLKFCYQLLRNGAITNDRDMLSLSRTVVYVILDGCLQFFEADSLGGAEDLIGLFYDILKDESVSDVFWSKDFASGAAVYILNELYRFNACFERPLRILRSLASASLESSRKISTFWRKVPVLSEPIADIDPDHLARAENAEDDAQDGDNGTTVVVLLKSRNIYGDDGFMLPVGTRGQIFQESELVQWEFSYNAWQLCLLETIGSHPSLPRVSLILNLVAEVMDTDPSAVTLFVHFVRRSVAFLKRSVYFEVELPVEVLGPCLRCLAIAAKTFPYEVLSQMGQEDILPKSKCAGAAESSRLSLLTRLLNDVERLSGKYDCTISFLRIIEPCCEKIDCYEMPCFLGSLSFICDHIFAEFLSWSYENVEQRNEIGGLCLRICRKVLEKWTTGSDDAAGASVKHAATVCRNAISNGEARRVLLRLASVGVDALKDPCDPAEERNSRDNIIDIVCLSLALLLELLIDLERTGTTVSSKTPRIFYDLFMSMTPVSNVLVEPPLCAIGRYLFLRTNDRIPKLAIICLKRIAKQFRAVMLSAFGEWSPAFCDAFLTRLESPTEDLHLKVNCVEFLSAAVEYQPGLAEQLLGVSSTTTTTEGSGDAAASTAGSSNSNSNCDGAALSCILSLMKHDRLPPDLAVACVNLFATIWRVDNVAAIDYLRNVRKEDFWTTLLVPLSAGEENYYLAIVSPIFRILCRELFAATTTTTTATAESAAAIASSSSSSSSSTETPFIRTVVEEITDSERVKLTFKKLRDYCESNTGTKEKVEILSAWTDFLQVFLRSATASGTGYVPASADILNGSISVMTTVLANFGSTGDLAVVKAASDLCGLALKYCVRNGFNEEHEKDLVKRFEPILCRLNDANVEEWVLTLSSIVLPACCSIFNPQRIGADDADTLPAVFDTLCSILVKILINAAMLRTRDLLSSPSYPWKKALQYSLHCVSLMYGHAQPLVQHKQHSEETPARLAAEKGDEEKRRRAKYSESIQKHSILRNLRVLTATLLEAGQFDLKLFTSMCLVFEIAARSADSLSIIKHSGFLEWICVKLVVASKEIIFNVDILTNLFNVYGSIMETGMHHAVPEAAVFVASYSDIIAQLLFSLPYTPTARNGKAASAVLRLLTSLAHYKQRWYFEAGESMSVLIDSVSILCYRLPPYLAKPTALAEVISKAEVGKTPPEQKIQNAVQLMLFEIMFSSIQFLLCFSPDLTDVCNNPTFAAESFRPLLRTDLNTNIAPDHTSHQLFTTQYPSPPLTFGAILLTIQVCVNTLRKSEPARTASPSVHQRSAPPLLRPSAEKTMVASLLDSALYFVLSQVSLYLVAKGDGALDEWQLALLKRDLASELSPYLSRSGIRASGGSAPSTPGKSPTIATPSVTSPGLASRTAGLDVKFLRFANDFVRDVLRNND